MKYIFTTLILMSTITYYAQQQIENPGFESWENVGTVADEPVDWSSIKTADALAALAPQVWFQSTDAHSGSYSVKLENKSSFGIVASGILSSGRIHADLNPENGYVFADLANAEWNTPFTDRPDSLVGWFKFAPVSSDAGKAQVVLHTGACQIPENGTQSNWVAEARFDFSGTTSSWTRFSVPFNYFNSNTPQYLLAVLVSGDSTLAVAGSVAFFDDLELIYNPANVEESDTDIANIFVVDNMLNINFSSNNNKKSKAQIIDLSGRIIWEKELHFSSTYKEQMLVTQGIYIFKLATSKGVFTKKVVF
jgi:hypothetical protein